LETDEAFADVDEDFHRLAVVDIGGIELLGIGAAGEGEGDGLGFGGALLAAS
jgi:hypothetical protein